MLEIENDDFCSLDSFPLKWRWTDSRWNIIPKDALKFIQPFREDKSLELCQYALTFQDSFGLDSNYFEHIEKIGTDAEVPEIRQSLLKYSIEPNQMIIISWDQHLAVSATWEVFCNYWSDFCYPSSDDVAIFPISEEWMLAYSHDEYFTFGKKR